MIKGFQLLNSHIFFLFSCQNYCFKPYSLLYPVKINFLIVVSYKQGWGAGAGAGRSRPFLRGAGAALKRKWPAPAPFKH